MDNQKVGLSGEFFVAAELLKRDFQVSITFGNAKNVDLFIQSPNDKIYSVQVKTLRNKNCFDLRLNKVAEEIFYVFVFLNDIGFNPEYFILKGSELIENKELYFGSSLKVERQAVNYGPLLQHKDKWNKLK